MRSLLRVRPRSDRHHHRNGVSSPGPLSITTNTPSTASTATAAPVSPALTPRMGSCSAPNPAATLRPSHQRPDRHLPLAAASTWLSSPSLPADEPGGSPAEALDWHPRLPLASTLLCLALAAAATAAAAFLLPPSSSRPLSLRCTPTLALLFIAAFLFTRSLLRERLYLAHTRPEASLADPHSSFTTLSDVTVHYKTSLSGHTLPDPNRRPAQDRLSPPPPPPPSAPPSTAVHCYHGFGANLYSFDPVHRRLSADLDALVTSHDMPGFGLTSRPPAGPHYYLSYNGRLGRRVQDQELSRLGLLHPKQQQQEQQLDPKRSLSSSNSSSSSLSSISSATVAAPEPGDPPQQQQQQQGAPGLPGSSGGISSAAAGSTSQLPAEGSRVLKRVLIGHSMGAICAALQALEAPEDVAALVLVAPAILVMPGPSALPRSQLQELPPLPALTAPGADVVRRFAPVAPPSAPAPTASGSAPPRAQPALLRLAACVSSSLRAVLLLCVLLLLRVLRPLLVALLRSVVRSRQFWVQGLSQAFHDKKKLTDKALDQYRLPQLVRGWEAGMCQFIEARLAPVELADVWRPWRAPEPEAGDEGAQGADLVQRLAAAVRRRSASAAPLRVLLVHGRGDALVPAANSERLARLLPAGCGVELALMERCGHMPHEEWPETFSQLVTEFVSRA